MSKYTCFECGSGIKNDTCAYCEDTSGTVEQPCSPYLRVHHDRWTGDSYRVVFRVNSVSFIIGAECSDKRTAERIRTDFETALNALGVKVENVKDDVTVLGSKQAERVRMKYDKD